ncbi:MFS transporter [Pseudonocardia sp. C8]|uniref:MFS transporter n=1 Tax=Pseudonocardia sp. C8 TaxID=2762759 RepID=UPI001642B747|nr:MFS transporter [Pseudonocardia sp. C8]MBC3192174.1 MFS transporter [Pseudonocardia sp. C8]
MNEPVSRPAIDRTPPTVLLLCLACMTLEGYDVIAFGAALPLLLADTTWNVTVAQAGLLGSLTPVGMLVGAVGAGLLTDRLGRRRLVLLSTAVFSLAMILSGIAPTIAVLAAGRFLVGLGVGGVLPSITALVYEYSGPGRRNINTALTFAGIGIGGAASAVVAGVLGPEYGFRVVFLVGGLAAVVILPAAIVYLPESLIHLRSRGRVDDARRWAARLRLDPAVAETPAPSAESAGRLTILMSAPFRRTTVVFCLMTFASLLTFFGLYTWLPQLMRSAGYELGSALTFLVVLNLGTTVGPLCLAFLADRIGSRPATAVAFLIAAVGVAGMSRPLPGPILYGVVVLAGIGAVGTQILINVFIASRYPIQVRATAIGTALSAGRLGGIVGPVYGALLVSSNLSTVAVFLAFAAPAVVGATLTMAVPRASQIARGASVRPHRTEAP